LRAHFCCTLHGDPRCLHSFPTRRSSDLNPHIGYRNATEVAMEAHRSGRGVYEIVQERGLMAKDRLDAVLRPEALTVPVEWQVGRSEEHTSELQSRENLVCRLLLEKKNTT